MAIQPPFPSDDPIRRYEYEARHLELQRQITQLSTDLTSIESKLDTLSSSLSNSKASVWQFIAVTAINFTLSGGLIGFLAFTGHFH